MPPEAEVSKLGREVLTAGRLRQGSDYHGGSELHDAGGEELNDGSLVGFELRGGC